MPEGVLHSGRVVFAEGKGAPLALVTVARGTAPTPEIAIRCDGEGNFHTFLPHGRYIIEALAPNGTTGSVEIATGVISQLIQIIVGSM
jgi:hypothetical protein